MLAKERAKIWATDPHFDEKTREAAAQMLENEEELLSAFGTELAFGTGGLRGVLGVGTDRMNEYTVGRATQGLADYLREKDGKSVAIGYDSRLRSREFAYFAAGVLARNGLTAHVYPRLMPTPMLSFAVRELGCDAGIVITASHNPAQYNGYKVYGSDGCQITQEAAEAITDCIEKVPYGAPQSMPEAESRAAGLLRDVPEEIVDRFLEKTLSCRVAPEAEAPLHLIYTPLHGTGLEPVTKTFRRMKGIQFTCVTEQTTPDGHFPTCPKPNPELREALRCGLELAEKENASLLIATDPDCDRVGVAVREKDGRYTVLTGNEVGLLLLEHILKTRTALGTMPENPVVVKTIVTSDLAFAIARRYGAEVTECLTGFKYIGEQIKFFEQSGAHNYVFGLEESYGCLAGTYARDKDACVAVMMLCEVAAYYKQQGKTLWDAMVDMYEEYGYYKEGLATMTLKGIDGAKEIQTMMTNFRENPPKELGGFQVLAVRDYKADVRQDLVSGEKSATGLPSSNVLYYELENNAWCCVRPSGTEPKIKFYFGVKGTSLEDAAEKLEKLKNAMVTA